MQRRPSALSLMLRAHFLGVQAIKSAEHRARKKTVPGNQISSNQSQLRKNDIPHMNSFPSRSREATSKLPDHGSIYSIRKEFESQLGLWNESELFPVSVETVCHEPTEINGDFLNIVRCEREKNEKAFWNKICTAGICTTMSRLSKGRINKLLFSRW